MAALGGGGPGAMAMLLQVLLLCWLRTVVHVQQVKGGSFSSVLAALYREGGLLRLYQGVLPALVMGPLCRFGDTAANAGALALLSHRRLPIPVKTAAASAAAMVWRALLTPLDTFKLLSEVEGFRAGYALLLKRVHVSGPGTLFAGAAGGALAAGAAHHPWYCTYNFLTSRLKSKPASRSAELWRSAGIGFLASLVSDVVANPLRVLKATVQSSSTQLSYATALVNVLSNGGLRALLTRGLSAKLLMNALQGCLFTVLWRALQDALARRRRGKEKDDRVSDSDVRDEENPRNR